MACFVQITLFCDLVSGLKRRERSRQCSLIYTPRGIMGYLLLCKLHALFPVVKIDNVSCHFDVILK